MAVPMPYPYTPMAPDPRMRMAPPPPPVGGYPYGGVPGMPIPGASTDQFMMNASAQTAQLPGLPTGMTGAMPPMDPAMMQMLQGELARMGPAEKAQLNAQLQQMGLPPGFSVDALMGPGGPLSAMSAGPGGTGAFPSAAAGSGGNRAGSLVLKGNAVYETKAYGSSSMGFFTKALLLAVVIGGGIFGYKHLMAKEGATLFGQLDELVWKPLKKYTGLAWEKAQFWKKAPETATTAA